MGSDCSLMNIHMYSTNDYLVSDYPYPNKNCQVTVWCDDPITTAMTVIASSYRPECTNSNNYYYYTPLNNIPDKTFWTSYTS